MIHVVKNLIPYIRSYWKRVVGSVIFAVMLAAIKGTQAYLVKPIFDKGLSTDGTFEEALWLAGILLGLGILNFPCRFFHFYWIRYVVDASTCSIREKIYHKFQALPLGFYAHAKQGNLISNMLNDTMVFSQGLRNVVDLIREPLTAMVMFGLALYRDWQLTIIIVLVSPLFVLIFGVSGRKVRNNQREVQHELSELTHNINEGIGGQKVTKAFNLQDYVFGRFRKTQQAFFGAQMRTTMVEEVAHPLVELVGAIAFSGVILFAYHRISTGQISTGDFVSFITALALLMDPIRKFSQANVKLHQAQAAGERIFSLLDMDEECDGGDRELPTFQQSIEVENVTFSYGEGEVLQNFSMSIKKGEKVALVGPSGSGKSTLVNLLLGLYSLQSGDIKIDGISIKEMKLKSLRNLFGLVNQEIFLFHDTVMENLKLGSSFSEAEVKKALEISYADEFVHQLPHGADSMVGDRGTKLSGGQRQRITIARAFLQKNEILLFDEATSALDNESEKVVQEALERLASDKTVLAVAHRLSTIQNYDRIYVLREGKLIEEGNHQQLIAHNGDYARLYELTKK